VVEDRPSNPDFDDGRCFALKYTSADEWRPHGFSGGGAWFRRETGSKLWSANPQLGGITQNYYAKTNLIECVKIEIVIQFLADLKA
jgi:hypothetical protein